MTDVEMPGLSGPALVHDLLETRSTLKVLYISGSNRDNPLLQRHILEQGCCFLRKPFSPADLVSRVHSLLGRHMDASAEQPTSHRSCA